MTSHLEIPNLLAIDISSNACSIALLTRDNKTYQTHIVAPMQQSKLILPEIEKLLSAASLSIMDLDTIAYGCGPGSFTGLRLACSIVQALGFRANISVIPISSLAALAQTVHIETHCQKVMIAIKARKDHVYWASYQMGDQGVMTALQPEKMILTSELALPDADWQIAGDGWDVSLEQVSSIIAPSAIAILPLAMLKWRQKASISPSDAIPVYLDPYKS